MRLRRSLLICGVLSSLLYVGINVLAAVRHGEYHSFTAQTISELSARGAPTKQLVDPFYVLYDMLAIAFGVGVWLSARGSRALRVTAGLLIGFGALGLPGPRFFAMNLRGSGGVAGDIPHIVATGVLVVVILAAVAVGGGALGRRFRLYSFATFLAILGFGALVSIEARGLVTGQPTPWIGITERLCIGAFLLWVVVLAISLLRAARSTATSSSALREGGLHPRYGARGSAWRGTASRQ